MCPSPKVRDFWKKLSLMVSVIRGRLDTYVNLTYDHDLSFREPFIRPCISYHGNVWLLIRITIEMTWEIHTSKDDKMFGCFFLGGAYIFGSSVFYIYLQDFFFGGWGGGSAKSPLQVPPALPDVNLNISHDSYKTKTQIHIRLCNFTSVPVTHPQIYL